MTRCYLVPSGAECAEVRERCAQANPEAVVQVVDRGCVKNEALVEMLAAQTLRARRDGSLLAKKPEVDLLLRIAGTTQIRDAIEKAGARAGRDCVLVVAGEDRVRLTGLARLPRAELTEEELMSVERASLLDVARS